MLLGAAVLRATLICIRAGRCDRLEFENGQVNARCLPKKREPVREEFQSNEAMELGVLRLINHTHTAATKLFYDTVVRDGLPDQR